jgi:EmrB/QacA subfamily drug resistance transporter
MTTYKENGGMIAEEQQLDTKKIILIMAGLMISVLLSGLDSTVVGTAMPRIIGDLQGMDYYTWPFTSYMLWSTIAIVLFGKISDTHGRKPIFLGGIIIFLVGSALCGLSQNMTQLIIFRGLQGVGGGVLVSIGFTVLGDLFPPRQRGKYAGMLSSMFGIASLIGPVVGGFITDNLSWRWVFYVNLPLGLIAIFLILAVLPNFKNHNTKKVIDYKGAAALTLALVPLILAFSWGGTTYPWFSFQITGMLIFSAVMLIVFYFIEKRAAEPIIPFSIFNNPVFTVSIIAAFLANAVMFCGMIYVPLFMQGVVGLSATMSGFILSPALIGLSLASIVTGQIISRTGRYKILAITGFVIILAGILLLYTVKPGTPAALVLCYSGILGIGSGMTFPVFSIAVQNVFPPQQLGLVTSSVQFFRNMGATIGTAIFGSVMLGSINSGFAGIDTSSIGPQLAGLLRNPRVISNPDAISQATSHVPADIHAAFIMVLEQARSVLANSIDLVFLTGLVMACAALLITFFLKDVPLSASRSAAEDTAERS